jgi:hypothetical protein
MCKVIWTTVCALCLTGAACSPQPLAITIYEDGCVTGSGTQFVLTDLVPGERDPRLTHERTTAAAARPTTEAYLLVGADEQLRDLAGRRARIVGEAYPAEVVEIRSLSPLVRASSGQTPTGTTGGNGGTPKVGVEEHVRFELHRLRVISATPTGDDCMAVR